MANQIDRVPPPVLPQPRAAYTQYFFDSLNNVLRLFFTRLTNTTNALLSSDNGGKALYFPAGRFRNTATQTATLADTAYAVTFNATPLSLGVSVVSNSRLTVAVSGVYAVNFALHIDPSGASEVATWMRVNGTDSAGSTQMWDVSANVQLLLTYSDTLTLEAGDYVELYWASSLAGVQLTAISAVSPYPAGNSATASVVFAGNS